MNPGQRLGRYRIEGMLGCGGMATVYLARHLQLGSLHALKVLHTRAADGHSRLLAEGQAQSRLSHPHLVPVTDIIEADGTLALVMAFVRGPTLQGLLCEGPLTLLQADHLARGILRGVAAAHRAGLVHRDLKPSNVLLAVADGEVLPRVTDFGLVKVSEEAPTSPGLLLGTPAYMSPEQVLDAASVDVRSDVFSLGAVLYELLCGEHAFQGSDRESLLAAVRAARYLPLAERVGELPERMVCAVSAALAVAREARPANAGALLQLWQQDTADPLADTSHPEARALAARVGALTRAPPELPSSTGWPVELPTSLAATLDPSPARSVAPVRLPAERDDFVGRAADLAALARDLAQGTRLVTVLGFGGTGKTRLVVRYGWQHQKDWPGGLYFCDLTDARNVDGIVSAVARALDVPLRRGDTIVQVGHALAGCGRCLILLDNFEHLVGHAAETLGRWLDRAGEASFVVTSRELLALPGERLLELAPLPEEEAAELFCVRARAVDRSFAPSGEEQAAVARLVGLLDGLPLAIELAAARVRTLSPCRQLSLLGERFRLLAGKGRPERHATLRATLDWSWGLLTDTERAGLCQLSVFEGGWTAEAALAVLEVGEDWPADILQALVDKSLVRKLAEDRFGLLVSVKEYAAQRLAERGELARVEARHGRYYARFGTEEAVEALDRHGGVQRRKVLVQERDNLVVACQRALARGDGPVASAAALAAWAVLDLRGPFALGASLLEAALEHAQELEVRLCCSAGQARQLCGQAEQARAHFERAHRLAIASGNRRHEGIVLQWLGGLHHEQGRPDEARARFEQALVAHREVGNRHGEGIVLGNLGILHKQQGRLDEARAHYEAALHIHREVGNRRSEGIALGNFGILHTEQGRTAEAHSHYEAALRIHRETGDRWSEGVALSNFGSLHHEQGRVSEARGHFERALRIHREVGNRHFEGTVLGNLGMLHKQQGRLDEARKCCDAALRLHRETGNRRAEGILLSHLGSLHAEQGRMAEAHSHYEASLHIHREMGNRRFEGAVLSNLGNLHKQQGQLDEAQRHYEAALHIHQGMEDRRFEGIVLVNLGCLHHERGLLDEAREDYERALRIYREVGHRRDEGVVLGALGRLHAEQGRPDDACTCFDTAEALLREASDLLRLGEVLAARAIVEHRAGHVSRAREKLHEAQRLAEELELGCGTALGRAIAEATSVL
jgi:predicted ATPase/Tfp pilus assembly protein PilF